MIKYILMVFAGACSFGILSTFAKLAYHDGYTAAEITFSQAFIGMAVLWLLTFSQPKKEAFKISWPLLLTGVAIGLTTFVYYVSVRYIPASLAVVILMQFTWMGALLEWVFYKKKPGWQQVIIMLLILGGTVMASGLHVQAVSFKGVLFALAAALLYAVYVVASSRVVVKLSSLRKSAIIMTGSTIGIFITNAPALLGPGHFSIVWALFFATFGTIIPQLLFAKGIPKVGAGFSAIIMTVELPVAVLTAHVVLHEAVSITQWIGIAVMLLSMALMNVRVSGR